MCYNSMNHSNAVCQRKHKSNHSIFLNKISSQAAETLNGVNCIVSPQIQKPWGRGLAQN